MDGDLAHLYTSASLVVTCCPTCLETHLARVIGLLVTISGRKGTF